MNERHPSVVLITGCSSGIGRALCEAFQRRGCRVVATARRIEALEPLRALGMVVEPLDVNDAAQAARLIERVLDAEGHIDVLVNNAGYGLFGPLLDLPDAELIEQFQTNLFAPLRLARLAAPAMRVRGGGVIVNIGSVSGIMTTPFAGAYCASKAALHAASDALRMELAPFGIRVVTVEAGAVESNFGQAGEAQAARLIPAESWYAPLREAIFRRAQLSQAGATPAREFAEKLVRVVLRGNPPAVVRIGRKSLLLPLLKRLLPERLLDRILRRAFALAALDEGKPKSD